MFTRQAPMTPAPSVVVVVIREHAHTLRQTPKKRKREYGVASGAKDDERRLWGFRHRMPQRASTAWPNQRCAHCHLPPRALSDAQPRQHGAQCAGHHNKQFCAPPTVLITRHQSCAPRGRVRRTNASRFAHASSRLRIASRHPTCSSFCSTHRSPACAACCTALCKRRAREPSRGPGQRIWKQDGARSRSAQAATACAMRQRRNHGASAVNK